MFVDKEHVRGKHIILYKQIYMAFAETICRLFLSLPRNWTSRVAEYVLHETGVQPPG